MNRGRPVGFKESEETREKKSRAMKDRIAQKNQPPLEWNRPGWRPFGDRIDFLSEEARHLQTGTVKILPAKEREPRA